MGKPNSIESAPTAAYQPSTKFRTRSSAVRVQFLQLFPLDAPAPLWFVAFVLITQIRTRSHGLRPDDVIEAVETPDGVSEAIELTHILGRVGAEERIPRESFGLR